MMGDQIKVAAAFGEPFSEGCVRSFLKMLRFFYCLQMTRIPMWRPTIILLAQNLGSGRPLLEWNQDLVPEYPTNRCMYDVYVHPEMPIHSCSTPPHPNHLPTYH